jgi:hypothetical protein
MPSDPDAAEKYQQAWRRLAESLGSSEKSFELAVAGGFEEKPPSPPSEGVDVLNDPVGIHISDIIDKYGDKLIQDCPGTGVVALSLRYTDGEILPEQPCLTFFVDDKEAAKHKIPREIDGVLTDIVEAGIPALQAGVSPMSGFRIRPAEPGCSISHLRVTSGTLGCLVEDDQGVLYVLSCAHVLSDKSSTSNDSIVQPGSKHGGVDPPDCIAKLTRSVPLKSGASVADAAIAEVIDPACVTSSIRHIGAKPRGTRSLKAVGIQVQKSGAQTDLTQGVVTALRGRVGPLSINGVNNVFFKNTIVTDGMSQGGDSGAILLDYPQNAVGMLFGGMESTTPAGEIKVAASWYTPINVVLRALGVHLV